MSAIKQWGIYTHRCYMKGLQRDRNTFSEDGMSSIFAIKTFWCGSIYNFRIIVLIGNAEVLRCWGLQNWERGGLWDTIRIEQMIIATERLDQHPVPVPRPSNYRLYPRFEMHLLVLLNRR
jgi:hypothetical protein